MFPLKKGNLLNGKDNVLLIFLSWFYILVPCSSSAAALSANANTNLLNGVIKDSGGKLCNRHLLSVKHIQAIPNDILNCGIVS